MKVEAWEEKIKMPTYKTGMPDKNPIFMENRIYQGSSGKVYPHPVIDKVYDEKGEQEYTALFLENEYLKIMVLPELGGRIHMALDKTNNYHFIYYNRVIKPALVGLTGPWVSGGIEFNWPQHHRPSTFCPVDYLIKENEDGSKTIIMNEIEIMFRTKGMASFTLYPGKAYLEITGNTFNRTNLAQTFLWWANPAVHVDEHYQSVFPPDVNAVYDHGRRDVSSFPIATGTYYKVNYAPGTDISRYKNIPVPTSYMAVDSEYNFIGGYHHLKEAGIMNIADHHIAPGKKQWTWGNGDFGKMWDKNLTDEDGPYFELMAGIYTDNQPDFSFIMPLEEREFKQYFMPYKKAGYVKNATINALVNLEFNKGKAIIKVYATSLYENAKIILSKEEEIIFSDSTDISPTKFYEKEIQLPGNVAEENIKITVESFDGKLLVDYTNKKPEQKPIPKPATPIPHPKEIKSNDALFLAGTHIEQYRHATFKAEDYYLEALSRDPEDYRCNNAMGLVHFRRGKFHEADKFFRRAIESLMRHNANPYDGEPLFNLGLCLRMLGKNNEAYKYFYKACWNAAWQDQAYLQLAQIASIENRLGDALEFCEKSLIRNQRNFKTRDLKIILLRKLNRLDDALKFAEETLKIDPFDFGCRNELSLILNDLKETDKAIKVRNELFTLMRNNEHSFIETALDYTSARFITEAIELLNNMQSRNRTPMFYYYQGYLYYLLGKMEAAKNSFLAGFDLSPNGVFPSRLEDLLVLEKVIEMNSSDYKAYYYLGNFWYDKKQYSDAIKCWQKSIQINSRFPTSHRNFGLALFNKLNKPEEAIAEFETAWKLDAKDSRILYELDQLYKRTGRDINSRLKLLEQNYNLAEDRDNLFLELITLYNLIGENAKALSLLENHKFHPWEGGEGKVSEQFVLSCRELAIKETENGNFAQAIIYLTKGRTYPENLGEGKLFGFRDNDLDYLSGLVMEKIGDDKKAVKYFTEASHGSDEPVPAIFYNDQPPEKIFYKAMALLKLKSKKEAEKIFNRLIDYGNKHFEDDVKIDFFAVSLPDMGVFDDNFKEKNTIHCYFMIALGYIGLTQKGNAKKYLERILKINPAHSGAVLFSKHIDLF